MVHPVSRRQCTWRAGAVPQVVADDVQALACGLGRDRAHADDEVLFAYGVYDQLDLSNLAVIEAIARRAELIEYQYRERAREGLRVAGLGTGESSASTGAAVLGGKKADLSDGVGEIAGGAMVAPMMVELFVANEFEKLAKIDMQARKDREEKAALRNTRQPVDDPNAPAPADDGGKGGRRRP